MKLFFTCLLGLYILLMLSMQMIAAQKTAGGLPQQEIVPEWQASMQSLCTDEDNGANDILYHPSFSSYLSAYQVTMVTFPRITGNDCCISSIGKPWKPPASPSLPIL